ncbi:MULTISPECIES: hypothetical protein [Cyclobacterium]|uniref:Uncharacterized protein n=1 Tax=Cyclobacterium plantarum TaxID=2716263 RepID=A0ABX0HA83_9BACT|nr:MULTISPECIES: hypothetical protein [Cyclobacterium]MBD3630250.1 hypothetical protein [Cyclobacterium sp.]NHE57356.1 hypothetical protein [Cyclobacterium plantarum]
MDLLIGALFVLAIILALFLIFKRIFNRKKGKVDASQEISSKEVLGKEVSNMEDNPESQKKRENKE